MDLIVARNFLIALLIGALVGIEREKKKADDPGQSFGGIRTYTLLSLLGAAAAWLSRELGTPWLLAAVLLVVGAAVVASYVLQARSSPDMPGLTSEVAAVFVCVLGALVVVGNAMLAVALAVVTSALLAFKQPLHGMVKRIGTDDLFAGIKLLIASCIVLPLLPDHALDPWGALNPYALWLLVILISALSLMGYVAVRLLGPSRGAAVTGLAGGLVSSTATTLSFARQSATQADGGGHALAAGVLLSWLVMAARLLVVVALLNPGLASVLAAPLGVLAATTAAFAARHYWASRSEAGGSASASGGSPGLSVRNPFSLAAAMQFGALFAIVMLATRLAQLHAPQVGVYLVSVLAGLVDVDAIALSMARMPADGDNSVGAVAITLAALSNTTVKAAMVTLLGRGPLRRHMLVAAAAIVLATAGAAWLLA